MQIIMTIFALIDWMVYGLVSEMFSLIFLIAEVDIFKDGALDALSNRVYGVLGVIILFKIVISAIQYLISPDKLSDKDKGMGGLLTRTIISIALLALVPTIFTFAKDAQVIVSKAIPAIIIGREVGADDTEDIKEAGNWMAFTTLSTFIQVKDDKKLGNDEGINDMNSFLSNITAGCGFFAPSECKYTYQFVFSIPVGIFMLYILLSMGIDIAIRSIKLGILQLLAPIPIASYINNQENFKSWYTTCFKVYADLFIRLILIYFIVFVMGIIASGKVSLGNNAFVVIYMIIAILMFAKSAPKFISDALGLKGDGMGGIADMFTRGAAFGGAGRAAYDTLKSNYITQRNRLSTKTDANGQPLSKGRQLAGALKSAAAGGASAFGRGMWMATWQGKKGFGEVRSAANKAAVAKRDERNYFHDNLEAPATDVSEGYTWADYKRDKRYSAIGIPSSPGFVKAQYDMVDQIAQLAGSEKSFGATKMNETPDKYKINMDGRDYTIATARSYAAIQVGTENVTKPDGSVGTWTVEDQAHAMQIQQEVEKRTSYVKTAYLLASNDPTAQMNREKTILNIQNNATNFDKGTLDILYKELSDGKYGLNMGSREEFNVNTLLSLLKETPDKNDEASINRCADILTAIKTGFEADRTAKYANAQAAEARAKKTQEAINNNKSGK